MPYKDPLKEKERKRKQRQSPHGREYARNYRKAHLLHCRELSRRWKRIHKDKTNSYWHSYRSKLKGSFIEDVDRLIVFEKDNGICYLCNQLVDPSNWHLEHMVPISRGGTHSYENVRVSHPMCNWEKGNNTSEIK
jgi:5-methylcytosine-specific restriction endonuclease McrA